MMDKFMTVVVAVFGLFVLFLVLVIMPVSFYTEAECLRNGYPKANVTIGLERYCSTLDGAVTVTVKKQ
jgi:hypothetical protein